ncbi:unnamed protein product [Allacma fusca]|uniref:Uncharacterized protein n=1 Tax=Allacma fusca TaxID=39272 RepID=A0A8J2L0W8_9HEXA|nr:unnamed protein product [Allacma fusca]
MADNARENVDAFGKANVFVEEAATDAINETTGEIVDVDSICSDDEDSDSIDLSRSHEIATEDEIEVMFGTEDADDQLVDEASKWASKDIVRLGCVNHAIQLVVKECLLKNPTAVSIQSKMDKLVAFFNRSNYWHKKLVKRTTKGLIKIGDTRWNGFLHSLCRLLEVNHNYHFHY